MATRQRRRPHAEAAQLLIRVLAVADGDAAMQWWYGSSSVDGGRRGTARARAVMDWWRVSLVAVRQRGAGGSSRVFGGMRGRDSFLCKTECSLLLPLPSLRYIGRLVRFNQKPNEKPDTELGRFLFVSN